jgi:thiamine kinase-like enzyme
MEDRQVKASIGRLFSEAGLDAKDLAIEAAGAGGNNRVFAVHARDAKYLAKIYFNHPTDKRDRLGTEYAFLSYAWDIGLRCVPRPISRNSEGNIGLYEFVEGTKLVSSELDHRLIDQAAVFFRELNLHSNRGLAGSLPEASEACFSVEQHFALVDGRIERLRAFPAHSPVDREALSFVETLGAAWRQAKERMSRQLGHSAIAAALSVQDRCVSPSDFGFHNALLRNSGEICFIDFEYAGWDDPAKAVGDFFCQPAIPVPLRYFEQYLEQAVSFSPNATALAERVRRLLPVFQMKWCCIMLNEFLPDAAQRRRFANPTAAPEQRKRSQLEKAQRFFKLISNQSWPT